jgi:hypothetical protein
MMKRTAMMVIALLGCAMLLLTSSPAEARNIFEIIFGPPAGSQVRRAHWGRRFARPVVSRSAAFSKPTRTSVVAKYRVRRAAGLVHPRIRTIEPKLNIAVEVEAKSARVVSDAERIATIMSDPTLRRGDIVEFPDGPRLYRGNGRFSSHRVSDFEDVREAGLVSSADPHR